MTDATTMVRVACPRCKAPDGAQVILRRRPDGGPWQAVDVELVCMTADSRPRTLEELVTAMDRGEEAANRPPDASVLRPHVPARWDGTA